MACTFLSFLNAVKMGTAIAYTKSLMCPPAVLMSFPDLISSDTRSRPTPAVGLLFALLPECLCDLVLFLSGLVELIKEVFFPSLPRHEAVSLNVTAFSMFEVSLLYLSTFNSSPIVFP